MKRPQRSEQRKQQSKISKMRSSRCIISIFTLNPTCRFKPTSPTGLDDKIVAIDRGVRRGETERDSERRDENLRKHLKTLEDTEWLFEKNDE